MHTDQQRLLEGLRIEANGVPIYVQLREQMLSAIGAGRLGPGQQMPTMRQLAVQLKVDLNTVRHAYDELERTGAITVKRARGTFVADRPPPRDAGAEASRIDDMAHQTIATALASGLDPIAVAKRIMLIIERKEGRQ
jgi:GntR family transcriptional regulator